MDPSMKILVAIANYGSKNFHYLQRLIDEYGSMSYDIDIAVLSNTPKDLPPWIEVRVGLPSSNPWSHPFAHKELFANRVNDYELFIYSEDDTLITQRNIEAFLEVLTGVDQDMLRVFIQQGNDQAKSDYLRAGAKYRHYLHTIPQKSR